MVRTSAELVRSACKHKQMIRHLYTTILNQIGRLKGDTSAATKDPWRLVCARFSEHGFDSLSENEQIWLNTRGFIDAVNDGGIASFFYNSWGDYYDDTTFALAQLQAFDALALLETMGELFGDEVPYETDERNAIMNAWDENGHEAETCITVDSVIGPLMPQLEETLQVFLHQHNLVNAQGAARGQE